MNGDNSLQCAGSDVASVNGKRRPIEKRPIRIPPSGLMTLQQAADYIGCSLSKLEKLKDRGPKRTYLGGSVRMHEDDVRAWVEEQRKAA